MAVDVAQIGIGRVRLALTLAALLLLAAIAGGVRAQNSTQKPSAPVQPLEFTNLSDVSPRVAAPDEPAAAPASSQTSRRSTAPAAAAPADPPVSNQSAGQTSVVAGNGTEETETNSGGAHVNNDATVQSETGMQSGDPQP